ncbi:MAG: SMI1/KNR4 family protein [Actinomyces succiniciruminis]|nr:SMI1/KNR4 family protein [Actinomyces succiniciruminis]
MDAHEVMPSPSRTLAETVARHFDGASVTEEGECVTVHLGAGLPAIDCFVEPIIPRRPASAFAWMSIRGAVMGRSGALVTASGYGDTDLEAVVAAGCNWACAFGPVLLTALGHPERIRTPAPDVEQYDATVGGRRYRITTGGLDRGINVSVEEVASFRAELGGSCALTRRVLESGTIPATRLDDVVSLGTFLAVGPRVSAEVKLGAADWPAATAVLSRLPSAEPGVRMLREWALLVPLEPAPPLTRDGLQSTLNLLRHCRDNPDSEAWWLGGRTHGMQLGDTAPADADLPEDMRRFMATVASSGAGPGYGLNVRREESGWVHLADAGCGAEWVLELAENIVWLDARACDGSMVPVASSFTGWYESWLDNAIRNGGPFAKWSYEVDAAYKMLADAVDKVGPDAAHDLVRTVKIREPGGSLVGPCHACQRVYYRYQIPSTVFRLD